MPSLNLDDTIAALSTPPGEGGMAVVRVSGKQAFSIVQPFFRSSRNGNLNHQPTHTVHHGYFLDEEGNAIDEILVSLFRSPHSYTGEDVTEISCHGGMQIVSRILERLVRAGARAAEPGEFTKRAFLNGKLDLTQAEAVLDLIRAKSDASLEAAFRQLQGGLSRKIEALKEKLLKVQAHLEAGLDFPDERLDVDSTETNLEKIGEVEKEIHEILRTFHRGALLREGWLVAIVGRPNVGKSSLLNALLAKDRALVSPIPGTTRDAVEEAIQIEGVTVRLVDTAGLTESPTSPLDQMGAERTKRYLEEANLLLFVLDGSQKWTAEDESILMEIRNKTFLVVVNKIDLPQKINLSISEKPCQVSCLTESGLSELEDRIAEKIRESIRPMESPLLTRLRHKQAFEKALGSLQSVKQGLEQGISSECLLIDLKAAVDSLRELIGEVYSEDLLDVIFQEFCIGK